MRESASRARPPPRRFCRREAQKVREAEMVRRRRCGLQEGRCCLLDALGVDVLVQ